MKTIKIPIFNFYFDLFVVPTTAEANSILQEKTGEEYNDNWDALTVHKDNYFAVIFVIEELPDYGILLHESIHLCNQLFRWIHFQPDIFEDEIQAYLTQYIFEEIKEGVTDILNTSATVHRRNDKWLEKVIDKLNDKNKEDGTGVTIDATGKPEWKNENIIAYLEKPKTSIEVAKYFQVKKNTCRGRLARLEQDGLIRKNKTKKTCSVSKQWMNGYIKIKKRTKTK